MTPPIAKTSTVVRNLWLETQSWIRAYVDGGGVMALLMVLEACGDGRGRADSGSHDAEFRPSLRAFEARSRCLSR